MPATQCPCSRLAFDVANQGQLARRHPITGPEAEPCFNPDLLPLAFATPPATDDVLDHCDRFVITRSDFVWLCPHPPLSVLDREAIWLPDGEHYSGLNDRHLVASRADVVNCLNILEDILLRPIQLYEEMKPQPTWNIEQFLAHHLSRKGLNHKVKLFPYVMYLARSVRDEPLPHHASPGQYQPAVRHFVKYENEFRAASRYATIIRSHADWEDGAWMQFDPGFAASCPVSLRDRLQYAWERFSCEATPKILSALRRPGRVGRFVRFCKRMMRRKPRAAADDPT